MLSKQSASLNQDTSAPVSAPRISSPVTTSANRRKVKRMVTKALKDWRDPSHFTALSSESDSFEVSIYEAPLAAKIFPVRPGIRLVWRQFFSWIGAILFFVGGTFWDVFRGRDSEERRAIRLRQAFEKAGGTLIKIGQQMSIRYDLLPYRYCSQLAQMLDNVPPFPVEEAIEIIERETGKSLDVLFSDFQQHPVGSASIACVYAATLRATGEKVAIKVQRPNIQKIFAADFVILNWLLGSIEWWGILRAGYSKNLRDEFRYALALELDFRREARCQIIFRKGARKLKKHISAPAVYFDLSTEKVLIQEFIEGIKLADVLKILKAPTEAGYKRLQELHLDPATIARRLLYANYWGMYENLLFHADPHPANIIVGTNNELVFIDFGACGVFDKARRALYKQMFQSQVNDDSWGMVQAILALLEPLPGVDINALARDFQTRLVENLIIFKSNEGAWYERTSAQLWLSALGLIGSYGISAPKDILLFARGSLLYDSLAAQLNPDINFFKEFRRYARDVGDKIGDDYRQGLFERIRNGLKPDDYLAAQQFIHVGQKALFRLDRLLSVPYDYAILPFTIEKSVYTVVRLLQFVFEVIFITGVCLGVAALLHVTTSTEIIDLGTVVQMIITHPIYALLITGLAIRHLRQILFRLQDKIHPGLQK